MGILYKLGLGAFSIFSTVARNVENTGSTKNNEAGGIDNNLSLDKLHKLKYLDIDNNLRATSNTSSNLGYENFLHKLGIIQDRKEYYSPCSKKLNESDLKEVRFMKQKLVKLRSKLDKAITDSKTINNKLEIDADKLNHDQIKQRLDYFNDKANFLLNKYQSDYAPERDLKVDVKKETEHTHITPQPEERMLNSVERLQEKSYIDDTGHLDINKVIERILKVIKIDNNQPHFYKDFVPNFVEDLFFSEISKSTKSADPFNKGSASQLDMCQNIDLRNNLRVFHKGHIISQTNIEKFLTNQVSFLDTRDKFVDNFLGPFLQYASSCNQVANKLKDNGELNPNGFYNILKQCIVSGQANVCYKFISEVTMWNPGNIAISPRDFYRTGGFYPAYDVDFRVLLGLDRKLQIMENVNEDCLKDADVNYYKKSLDNLLSTIIEVIKLVNHPQNNIFNGFSVDNQNNIKNIVNSTTHAFLKDIVNSNNGNIVLQNFFRLWGKVCKYSKGLYLNEDENIESLNLNQKIDAKIVKLEESIQEQDQKLIDLKDEYNNNLNNIKNVMQKEFENSLDEAILKDLSALEIRDTPQKPLSCKKIEIIYKELYNIFNGIQKSKFNMGKDMAVFFGETDSLLNEIKKLEEDISCNIVQRIKNCKNYQDINFWKQYGNDQCDITLDGNNERILFNIADKEELFTDNNQLLGETNNIEEAGGMA